MVAAAEARRRRGSLLAFGVVIALGLSAALGAFLAAYRTNHAYPEYLERARVADLVVNPSLLTTDSDAMLRSLPHVRHVWTDGLFFAGVDDGRRHTVRELLADPSGETRASTDGRFLEADRLIVTSGHAPSGARELFIAEDYRPHLEANVGRAIRVGDTLPLAFLQPFPLGTEPSEDVVPVLAVERLRVSGFGRLSDEVLNDDLFPRQRMIFSADVAAPYDCTPTLPKDPRKINFAALSPKGCALQYRFYALDVDDPHNVPAVEDAIAQRAAALNASIPAELQKNGVGYYPIFTTRSDQERQVQSAIGPTVVALVLFGGLAFVATLAISALAVARLVRQSADTDALLSAFGMSTAGRGVALSLPFALTGAVAILVAFGVGFFASWLAPVGAVRRVESNPSFSTPAIVTLPVLLGFAALLAIAIVACVALGLRRRADRGSKGHDRTRAVGALRRALGPTAAEGVRGTFGTGRAPAAALISACCVAVAALVGATVFGGNLIALVDKPQHYGWPWNVGVLMNYGYGGTNQERVRADLDARRDVASWDALASPNGTVNNANVPLLLAPADARPIDLPMVAGRLPRVPGEIALGASTASELGVHLGDDVDLAFGASKSRVKVVGTIVMPALGPFLSDRAGLGNGAFSIVPPATRTNDDAQGSDAEVTFVGITLEPGADTAEVLASLKPGLVKWDRSNSPPFSYGKPVRPPDIVNAESMRSGPIALAGLLALALMSALGLAITVSVNARRHDFAVLRAVGFTRAQVASSVEWQGALTMTVGLAVGVPAGLLVGRWSWRVFAHDLGVRTRATMPVLLIAGIALAAIFCALLVAARAAYLAARVRPADLLCTG
jgi:FtsX-like permease family